MRITYQRNDIICRRTKMSKQQRSKQSLWIFPCFKVCWWALRTLQERLEKNTSGERIAFLEASVTMVGISIDHLKCTKNYTLVIQNGFVSKVGQPEIPRYPGNDSYMIHFGRKPLVLWSLILRQTQIDFLQDIFLFCRQVEKTQKLNRTIFRGPKFSRSQILEVPIAFM